MQLNVRVLLKQNQQNKIINGAMLFLPMTLAMDYISKLKLYRPL